MIRMKRYSYTFPIFLVTFCIITGFSSVQNTPEKAHAHFHVSKNATIGYQNGYQPSQIKQAYGISQLTNNGTGQTIAIIEAYGSPSIKNDISTFDIQFGIQSANLNIAYPSGQPSQVNGNWAFETSLDVEWAHALAPGANILLVVASSASTSDMLNAIDYATKHGAQIISNSWGQPEFSREVKYDSYFQNNGIVYIASSGDGSSGSQWPSASPYVLSVGGTTLNIDTSGNYLGETGWIGSKGGPSSYESTPTYQTSWNSIVGKFRGTPDVSWDGDPNTGVAVYDSTRYNNQTGWFVGGGTSIGAPSWAALIALADQNRSSKLSSSDAITQIYNIAGQTNSTGYVNNYHDIIQGSNGNYYSQPGYDLVTGIGSPRADSLVNALTKAP